MKHQTDQSGYPKRTVGYNILGVWGAVFMHNDEQRPEHSRPATSARASALASKQHSLLHVCRLEASQTSETPRVS